jgi:hypothetical protein
MRRDASQIADTEKKVDDASLMHPATAYALYGLVGDDPRRKPFDGDYISKTPAMT